MAQEPIYADKSKADRNSLHILVILMSAHADLVNIGYRCLSNDFITKPFDVDDLLLRIHEVMK